MTPHFETGYAKIHLPCYINGEIHVQRQIRIYRALAMSFDIPGRDENRVEVNHINGDKHCNYIGSLWKSFLYHYFLNITHKNQLTHHKYKYHYYQEY